MHPCSPAPAAAGKPRGYAFIEYESKADMKTAYKMADGKKIEGRRVTVDVERGRTVPNWRALGPAVPSLVLSCFLTLRPAVSFPLGPPGPCMLRCLEACLNHPRLRMTALK